MKRTFLLMLLLFIGSSTFAQRTVSMKDGDYSFLRGVKTMNVQFNYDGMTVGKNQTEEEYVAAKVAEKNEKKPGSGDEWKKSWEKGKLNTYEPGFINYFNKKAGKKLGLKLVEGDEAEMTLLVNVTRIEPGFYTYAVNKSAEVDANLLFVAADNHDDIKLQVVSTNIKSNEAPDVSTRVLGCFMNTAGYLAKYIIKSLK